MQKPQKHALLVALAAALTFVAAMPARAQAIRTAGQLCSGASAVAKPPLVPLQAQTGAPGTILQGTYIVVICSIDNTGKYSAPSNPIVGVLGPGGYGAGAIDIGGVQWYESGSATGYELFIGVSLNPFPCCGVAASTAQLAILTSYGGPQILGSNLSVLPASITVSSIPTEALPAGLLGSPYSQELPWASITGTGGPITAGALPPGLSLNSRGLVSGTPTSGGTFLFSVTVSATTLTATGVPSQITVTQQFAIAILNQFTVSPNSVSLSASQNDLDLGNMVMQAVVIGSVQSVGNFPCS